MPKNKIPVIVAAIVAVLVIVGGGIFLATRSHQQPTSSNTSNAVNIKTLQPSDIGLQLSLSSDNQTVVMDITKLNGIKSVEYDMTYQAKQKDPDSGQVIDVTQGVSTNGTPVVIKQGQTTLERKIYLGTCSATCTPSVVISDVSFVIKVNYANGEIGQVQDKLPYPHPSPTPAGQ